MRSEISRAWVCGPWWLGMVKGCRRGLRGGGRLGGRGWLWVGDVGRVFGMDMARWILEGLGVYLALGVVFSVPFAFGLVGRVSPAARGAGWGFRLMILPGCAAVWPVLVWLLLPVGSGDGEAVR